jgi:hypothetical protein
MGAHKTRFLNKSRLRVIQQVRWILKFKEQYSFFLNTVVEVAHIALQRVSTLLSTTSITT